MHISRQRKRGKKPLGIKLARLRLNFFMYETRLTEIRENNNEYWFCLWLLWHYDYFCQFEVLASFDKSLNVPFKFTQYQSLKFHHCHTEQFYRWSVFFCLVAREWLGTMQWAAVNEYMLFRVAKIILRSVANQSIRFEEAKWPGFVLVDGQDRYARNEQEDILDHRRP